MINVGNYTVPLELVGPRPCRSNDCDGLAEFYADIPTLWRMDQRRPRIPERYFDSWDGYFCSKHLLRVLDLKIAELPIGVTLRIRKIV